MNPGKKCFMPKFLYLFAPILMVMYAQGETWKKIKLYDGNFGEAGTMGDFNHDGKMDVAAGMWWWEGPAFTLKHAFGSRDTKGLYSYDFNGDGWTDLISYSDQGGEGYIYINPKTTDLWQETKVLERTDGENPDFLDVTGDGKPEAFVYQNRMLGYYQADWNNPLQPWKFVSISPYLKPKIKWCHGYGFGDINKDGRPDILESDGWWENPLQAKPVWTFHPYQFGIRNGIMYFPFEDFVLYGNAHMFAYDVNNDGRVDVVSSVDAHGWGLAWFEQLDTKLPDGSPDFKRHYIINTRKEFEAGTYPAAISQMHAILMRDVNEDGLLDIVTGKRKWAHGHQEVGTDPNRVYNDPEPAAAGVIYWFELKRSGSAVSYIPHLVDSTSGIGTQFQMLDLNNDGHLDIVQSNPDGANVFLQSAPFPIKTSKIKETLAGFKSPLERMFNYSEKNSELRISTQGNYSVELWDLNGHLRMADHGYLTGHYHLIEQTKPGLYFMRISSAIGQLTRMVTILEN